MGATPSHDGMKLKRAPAYSSYKPEKGMFHGHTLKEKAHTRLLRYRSEAVIAPTKALN